MSAKLFVIELVYFTISCSNSTWATGPFIIWLDYSCLGYSVSWRKTKPSIIWPCHSFISYSILQLILKPALYWLICLTSLYFWWWRLPIVAQHLRTLLLLFSRDRCKGSHATLSLLIALDEFCDVCLSWRSTKGVEEGNDVHIYQF